MRFMLAILGGLAGGLFGALAWVLIGYFGHFELGIIAWGIGFLVGFGVRFGAQGTETASLGFVATAIAMGCVLIAKYILVCSFAGGPMAIGEAWHFMFGLFDLLWFGLAAATAFRVASKPEGY